MLKQKFYLIDNSYDTRYFLVWGKNYREINNVLTDNVFDICVLRRLKCISKNIEYYFELHRPSISLLMIFYIKKFDRNRWCTYLGFSLSVCPRSSVKSTLSSRVQWLPSPPAQHTLPIVYKPIPFTDTWTIDNFLYTINNSYFLHFVYFCSFTVGKISPIYG